MNRYQFAKDMDETMSFFVPVILLKKLFELG